MMESHKNRKNKRLIELKQKTA